MKWKKRNERNFIKQFFPKGKKGMETWYLILIILGLILIVTVIILYGEWGNIIEDLMSKFGDLI